MFFTPLHYFHTVFNLINELFLAFGYLVHDAGTVNA